jgi:glycosyltransferase involved in cell wall biosynthesis
MAEPATIGGVESQPDPELVGDRPESGAGPRPSGHPDRPRKLVIQIPCLDEAATLPATLADLPREVPGFDVVEWLVVDDGSTDDTARVALEHGVDHVVRHPANRGLAAAFLSGLDEALRVGADVVVNTDADNQYPGACIADLVTPIISGDADVVVGERPIESIESFSFTKKRLQRLGSSVVRWASGTDVRDAASGFRAFSREAALGVQVFGRYSYTMETLVQAGWQGVVVVGVPISVNPPTRASRLVRSTPQYLWRSATTIVRSFVLYKPMRFFVTLAAVPAAAAVLLALRWLYLTGFTEDPAGRVPSLVAAAVCALVGALLLVVGLLADLLSANRRSLGEVRTMLRRSEFDPNRRD